MSLLKRYLAWKASLPVMPAAVGGSEPKYIKEIEDMIPRYRKKMRIPS